MKMILHIENTRSRLILADDSGLSVLACWSFDLASRKTEELRKELLDQLDNSIYTTPKKLVVVVDLSGDRIHPVIKDAVISRNHGRYPGVNVQWIESNLRKHLGQQKLGVGLFKTGKPFVSQKNLEKTPFQYARTRLGFRGPVQKFYLLAEAFEHSPWPTILSTLDGVSIDAIYPLPLLIEHADIDALTQQSPVLFCHYDLKRVTRHSLYENGHVSFTRILPAEKPSSGTNNNLVFKQLCETLDYLQSRDNDISGSPVAVIPADVPLPEIVGQGVEIPFLKLPRKSTQAFCLSDSQDSRNKNSAADNILSETDQYCFSVFCRSDRQRQARLDNINFVELLEKHDTSVERLSPRYLGLMLIVLCTTCFTGWNMFRYMKLEKLEEINVSTYHRLSSRLNDAPLPPVQMQSMVRTHRHLTEEWHLPQQMLRDLGQLSESFGAIRLTRLDWCWLETNSRCLTELATEPRVLAQPVENSTQIVVRLKGIMEGEFSSLRVEFEHYLEWVEAISISKSFSVIRHDQRPYQNAIKSSADTANASQFAVVFSYSIADLTAPDAYGGSGYAIR